jgi:hypothetical protein
LTRGIRARPRAIARDTTFLLGGGLVIAMGVALAAGLAWAGAGWEYAQAWVGAAIAVGFGIFFVAVGRAERAERRRFLHAYDPAGPPSEPARR